MYACYDSCYTITNDRAEYQLVSAVYCGVALVDNADRLLGQLLVIYGRREPLP